MTTRRRAAPRRTSPARSSRRRGSFRWPALPSWRLSPEVTRSLVGLTLLALGAVTLIALVLPGGRLTDIWRDSVVPFFGAGRWILPFFLIAAGWYIEWGPGSRPRSGWQLTLVAASVSYAAFLGVLHVIGIARTGHIGQALNAVLPGLVTRPGAVIVLAALWLGGLLVALDTSLPTLMRPIDQLAHRLGRSLMSLGGQAARRLGSRPDEGPAANRARRELPAPRRGAIQPSVWESAEDLGRPSIPIAIPSSAPMSSTFAPAAGPATAVAGAGPLAAPFLGPTANGLAALATAVRTVRSDEDDVTDVGDSPPTREHREYRLPPLALLEDVVPLKGDSTMDHERNAAIIVGKLASFNIPTRVTRWNAGPVVTQYEVEPAPEIKVSRIEGLSDDLAMALAARTIRIEAPIPGKSVVGLEIPNKDFNIVALRRILEEVDFTASGSKLTFALGRDVAGHARAADLAKMPHLLIAGATGSGKSVMVNALITSLLCEATPAEVRLILMDLKRVELAAYNGLPHLMVPVITETERAKAALKWVVGEMESRYRRFAGATARNIAGYNETRADPEDRLPYIVVIVDELADLMMREGKNVEDPIVRLAQKARATGIHMVLATQRPSVNVVTGLIKANFPSRIAFAMASQIDSRTILDTPGAEDLIGRGDMLFQPADLPKPIRLQGVYVSDKEIHNVTEHWRAEAEPHYDLAIIENDEDSVGSTDDLADEEADRLLPDAVAVVQEYDRASASLLQRRLKIGYARAARIVDQLEARGYIGAFDGSNARQVLRRDVGFGTGAGANGLDGDEDDG